jgi:hypothetical protein
MKVNILLFLYGGPDQLMPITSGLTAVFALLLIFWNKVLVGLNKISNLIRRSRENRFKRSERPAPRTLPRNRGMS